MTEELATLAPALYSKIHNKSPTKSRPRRRRSTHFTYPGPTENNASVTDSKHNHFTYPAPGQNHGYVIDSIIDARRNGFAYETHGLQEHWEYLVTWLGWPPKENSWVTQYRMGDKAKPLIQAYWESQNDDFEYRKEQAMRSKSYLASVKAAYKFSKNFTENTVGVMVDKERKERANAE